MQLQNSVYIQHRTLAEIRRTLECGVTVLLFPPDFNHDFAFLAEARALTREYGADLKLMVNEGCIKRCPHRMGDLSDAQAYAIEDALSDFLTNPAETRVLEQPCRGLMESKGIGRTNYIHPQDISKYANFNPILKIVGRSFSTESILNACLAYVTEYHDGDLRTLIENFKHSLAPVPHDPMTRPVFLHSKKHLLRG